MDRTSVLVKFPAPLLARVEAFAQSEGKNRMAAILMLIERGLDDGKRAELVPTGGPPLKRSKTAVVEAPRRSASAIAQELAERRAAEDKRMAGWFTPKGRKT